ncbi:CPBP family intramembrane glutamic endopeptidase [Streptococcus ovuberis]|uniref:CPBP family intramembrane metalloprotease n=1 Tax=Streptococcus ovuberis TaxID=1936207 RepID=A0A7X6S170_9STRE|nr:type II CAAX endopeptidase family protein [Streptococcus ovuberis]NKZ20854.1 CPBP family intramembrane metalloprotease [Streptococcus ovuberis]
MKTLKNSAKFIGLIALILVINLSPMFMIGNQARTPVGLQWFLSIGYLILASLVIRLVYKRYKTYESPEVRAQKFGWKDLGIALLFFLGTRVIAIVGAIVFQLLLGTATSANDAALTATVGQVRSMFVLYFVAFHVAIGLFAPILEELVFRGLFTKYFFANRAGKWLPLILSSAIFALLHIAHPVEFIVYFPLGALFYLAYARRGNIKDSIAVHILNNSLLVILSIVNYILLMLQ